MNTKLKSLFCPESVAVIGASNSFDKLGYHVMKSLVEGKYQGRIFPVNPKAGEVWSLKCHASLRAIEDPVDLAVIVVPAPLVPETLHECGRKQVKGVVMITAGFREIEDSKGETLQEEIGEDSRDVQTSGDRPQHLRLCESDLRGQRLLYTGVFPVEQGRDRPGESKRGILPPVRLFGHESENGRLQTDEPWQPPERRIPRAVKAPGGRRRGHPGNNPLH